MIPTHRVTTHPGEMLLEEFLKPLEVSLTDFAKSIGVSRVRLSELVNGRRGITADTALRLSRALGNSAEFWMNLQAMHDLTSAMQEAKTMASILLVKRIGTKAKSTKARPAAPSAAKTSRRKAR